MQTLKTEIKWVIVSKDRKLIAKGVPRHRYLAPLTDEKDSKRILTYNSKKTAENAFITNGFYGKRNLASPEEEKNPDGTWRQLDWKDIKRNRLEAVKVEITLKIID